MRIIIGIFLILSLRGMAYQEVKNVYVTTFLSKGEYVEFKDIHKEENIYKKIKVLAHISANKNKAVEPNGVIYIRGKSTRIAKEKSYRIKFLDKNKRIYGYGSLNMNKSPFDDTKIRSKLSFDLMKEIDELNSSDAVFMRLFIKDKSKGETTFTDYGLFTHIEAVNKEFLEKRGLDKKGYLYKANYFEFMMNPLLRKIHLEDDYTEEELAEYIEREGRNGDKELVKMIVDINNPLKDIDDILNKNFDKENYYSWLAMNILFDNIDTNSQNYFLYKERSGKWQFIPWDYDLSWELYLQDENNIYPRAKWQKGISTYWNVTLHKRLMSKKKNRKYLSEKIEELSKVIDKKMVSEKIEDYSIVIRDYVIKDNKKKSEYLKKIYEKEKKRIPTLIEKKKREYYETLETPTPFFLGAIEETGENYVFYWSESISFEDRKIKYNFYIYEDNKKEKLVYSMKDIVNTSIYVDNKIVKDGMYWEVVAIDDAGNSQSSFDYIMDKDKEPRYGIKEIKF